VEADSLASNTVNAKHATHSILRERIVEHVFIGDAMRRLWQLGVTDVEVLRAEFDASGYDLVMCCGELMRHIQLKASLIDGSRAEITVNQRLEQAPSGCVVWLVVTDDLEIKEYRWFGAEPGSRLPDLAKFPRARHTRANAQGVKSERPNQRELKKSAFEILGSLDEVLGRLFGIKHASSPTRKNMDFLLLTNGVDETRPLLYQWEVHDARTGESLGRYVGRATAGSHRPRKEYVWAVRRLLAGLPYRKAKPNSFRVVHHALAQAVLRGDRITLTLLRNLAVGEDIKVAERSAIRELNCTLNG
jgi:hypothetical protein